MKKNILVCVAHRDDETIGCGATIYNHFLNGDNVFCLSMTDGVSARSNIKKIKIGEIKLRLKNSIKASKILKFKWIDHSEDFEDNQLDKSSLLKIIQLIEKVKKIVKPDIVYTHSNTDLNIDHQIVNKATLTAFRPLKKEKCQKILLFEVASSTDYSLNTFSPNYFENIKKSWNMKKKALEAYGREIVNQKSSRTIKGIHNLALFRGNMSGLEISEAFVIARQIKK